MLNVIGGLDHYDKGDLIINGKSTKNFKETDWDAYRNNSVGFIFQNYNLIPHLSIIANVELGMNLSGVGKKERHEKAIAALTKVGLEEHINKRPN
ncbi:putative ABC transporter ATP-binding protein YknY [Lactobacillus helveticus]|nr:putative ABC transporter ATP-binding protein YknY [Lactobacillus helveticus]